jgi:hypothetical protein
MAMRAVPFAMTPARIAKAAQAGNAGVARQLSGPLTFRGRPSSKFEIDHDLSEVFIVSF